MVRTVKTEAIVLKKRFLPSEDRIITLFTKDLGKLNVVAKGIRKITSRRLPHAETANLVKVTLHRSNDRFYLADSALLSGFTAIKSDRKKVEYLYYFFFILEHILPERQAEKSVYALTLQFMVELSKTKEAKAFPLIRYLNVLYRDLGFSERDMTFESLQRAIEETIHEKLPSISI